MKFRLGLISLKEKQELIASRRPSALRLRGTNRSEVPKSTDFVTSLAPRKVVSLRLLMITQPNPNLFPITLLLIPISFTYIIFLKFFFLSTMCTALSLKIISACTIVAAKFVIG